MTQLDIHEASERLADLIARVRAGEEVIIEEGGMPAVRMVLTDPPKRQRIFGEFKGAFEMSDDFTAPISDEDLAGWEK